MCGTRKKSKQTEHAEILPQTAACPHQFPLPAHSHWLLTHVAPVILQFGTLKLTYHLKNTNNKGCLELHQQCDATTVTATSAH